MANTFWHCYVVCLCLHFMGYPGRRRRVHQLCEVRALSYAIAVKVHLVNAKMHLNRAAELAENVDACEAQILDAATEMREARDELIREQGRRQVKKEVAK